MKIYEGDIVLRVGTFFEGSSDRFHLFRACQSYSGCEFWLGVGPRKLVKGEEKWAAWFVKLKREFSPRN